MAVQRAAADYPSAERIDVVEDYHGHRVADPYRWLEDAGDPRTRVWCAEQDELFARWRSQWLDGTLAGRLRSRLTELAAAGSVSAPRWRGERRFFTRRGPGQEHEVLLTAGPDGAERVLIDPAALDPAGSTTLDAWFPSREGTLLAYLLSEGGTEQAVLRVMDVATGKTVDGPIDRATAAPLAWLPGGASFYYQRTPVSGQESAGQESHQRRVYLHRIGTDPDHDALVFGTGLPAAAHPSAVISPDGRWLWLNVDWGPSRLDTYLADLAASGIDEPRFMVFQQAVEAVSEPRFGPDGRIYILTDREAENRRLCVTDPGHPDYAHWQTLLPEEPAAVLGGFAVLSGAGLARPLLLALRSRHAVSELTLHDLATGKLVATVPVPGPGTIKDLTSDPAGGPCAWFGYTDDRTPPSVYRFDARTGKVTRWAAAPATEAGRVKVRQIGYTSRDGTLVRMFILSPTGEPDRPRPAILYGYGSFGSSRSPAFNPLRLSWVEAGGVYAIANVRGGGEEGRAWHRAGRREHKQNTVDDLHAAGDFLVEQGWTTRGQLGLHGGSAGGQLVGMALTQRPDAYAAVLCSAPQLDMVRYTRFGLGGLWASEYGSPADPQEFGWLFRASPYHHLRQGTRYPATLLTVFANDSRVDPLHARKFAAALQHATSTPAAERPILLRREANAGHTTRAVSRSISLWLDQLCFFAHQLGLAARTTGG